MPSGPRQLRNRRRVLRQERVALRLDASDPVRTGLARPPVRVVEVHYDVHEVTREAVDRVRHDDAEDLEPSQGLKEVDAVHEQRQPDRVETGAKRARRLRQPSQPEDVARCANVRRWAIEQAERLRLQHRSEADRFREFDLLVHRATTFRGAEAMVTLAMAEALAGSCGASTPRRPLTRFFTAS